MSLLMDALKKADEAVDTPSTNSIEIIDLDNELLPQFQIDSQLNVTPDQPYDTSITDKWDDDFLPQFKEEQDDNEVKNNDLDTSQDSIEQDINNIEIIEEVSELPPSQTEIKLADKSKDIDEIQNLFSLTDKEHKDSKDTVNLPIVGITEQSPLEEPISELPTEDYQPQDAQRIFTATSPPNSSKRTTWLISIVGVLVICMGTGYYYLQSSFNQPSTIKFSKRPNLNKISVNHVEPIIIPVIKDKSLLTAPPPPTPPPKIKPKIKPKITKPIEKITKAVAVIKAKTIKPISKKSAEIITLRNKQVTLVGKNLSRGYTALQNGNNKTAKRSYQQALQQDKNNRDALLGLAALAIRSNNILQAQKYYQHILRNYPQDIHAQVGLINSFGNAPNNETQLKLLLRQAPKAAYIHFSLGNLYANQGRWSLAQQAYFDAMRYDNKNADYAYNLAISLDQINQPKAALTYYQKTLNLMKNKPISFDPKTVQKRIATLTKVLK